MCYIITHIIEFNNWRAFFETYEYIGKRYWKCCPEIQLEVPYRWRDSGWDSIKDIMRILKEETPEDQEEMSIYGKFIIEVDKNQNDNKEVYSILG